MDPYDIYMIAASDSNQNVYFQVPRGDAYHSSGGSVSNVGSNITNDGYWVNAVSIDDFLQGHTKNTVDLIKIDVEGYELSVLNGATKNIMAKRISIIQFEFTQLNTTTRIFFKDFYELLSDNYLIYRLLPNDLLRIEQYNPTMDEIFGYQNYVAILKDLE